VLGSRRRLSPLLLVAALALACQSPASNSPPPSPPPAVHPIAAADLAEAIRFRTEFGLRADEAYVRAVFANPTASLDFGVPLLPAEAIDLRKRASAAADVALVVRSYGATVPDEYAGVYIESATGNVYGLFTAHVDEARSAITARISPLARFVAGPARFALGQLKTTLAAAGSDEMQAWLQSIGAPFRAGSLRIAENDVWLVLDGVPDDIHSIARHLGVDEAMISITVEPDQLAKLPRGSIRGVVVDASGRAVTDRNLDVLAVGDISDYEPDGGTGIGTDLAGAFEIDRVAAMGWTITIRDPLTGATLGSTHTVVVAGRTATVRIQIAS
jgi:catechol 2,3-dioxygenase-like lactoylglutathione lyase family enzyme